MSARIVMATTASTAAATRLGEREQPWRGKYLRALNICPPDAATAAALVRRKSMGALTMRARLMAQRSWREGEHRGSNSSSGSSTLRRSYCRGMDKDEEEENDGMSPRVIDGRGGNLRMLTTSSNSRGVSFATTSKTLPSWKSTRRARGQSDPFGFDDDQEQVSMPIEIPQQRGFDEGRASTPERHALDRRRRSMHSIPNSNSNGSSAAPLVSWEDSSASDPRHKDVMGPFSPWNGNANSTECSDDLDGFVEDDGWDDDDEVDDGEGSEDTRSRDEDIFAMEEDLDIGSLTRATRTQLSIRPNLSSRSLRRAASENVLQINRHRRPTRHHLRGVHEQQQQEGDEMACLPESFVPPHEMIERDCFSLGLRDEFKRRPEHLI